MGLDKHAGNANRDRCAREDRNELALTTRFVALPAGCCTECVASKITGASVSRLRIGIARMSDTSVLYPNETPRSVTRILRLPRR
jgi:hypothetical protein